MVRGQFAYGHVHYKVATVGIIALLIGVVSHNADYNRHDFQFKGNEKKLLSVLNLVK